MPIVVELDGLDLLKLEDDPDPDLSLTSNALSMYSDSDFSTDLSGTAHIPNIVGWTKLEKQLLLVHVYQIREMNEHSLDVYLCVT